MNNTITIILTIFFAAIVITPAIYLIMLIWGRWLDNKDDDNDYDFWG